MNLNKQTRNWILSMCLMIILMVWAINNAAQVWGMVRTVIKIIFPFILGGAMAFILNCPMRFFEAQIKRFVSGRDGVVRMVSMLLSYLVVIGVIYFAIVMVLPQLLETITQLTNYIPGGISRLVEWLTKTFHDNPQISDTVKSMEAEWINVARSALTVLKDGTQNLVISVIGVAGQLLSVLFNFIIASVFSIYLLAQKEKLLGQADRLMQAVFEPKHYERVCHILKMTNRVFASFVSGQCIEAVIFGSLCYIGMSLAGIPYAMTIAVVLSLTALIPILGAYIGITTGVLLVVVVSPLKALIFVIVIVVIQQLEGNLIYPKVVGTSVGLPGVWVLVAVTVGGNIGGLAGMLVSVPVASVIYALTREWTRKRLREKGIQAEAEQEQEEK
ncbi:MAG: AI-2E family transporter [Lachnospiraceae bacterium]|nr:AI-2E family transporter [Lachnospiraceae bacterium]MDY5742374.1 AI-2E family transporter [Lachnospiraceae bacterium]